MKYNKETIKQLLKASKALNEEHGAWLREKGYKGAPNACVITGANKRDREMIGQISEAAGIKFVVIEVAGLRSMKRYWANLLEQDAISSAEYEQKLQEY